VRTLAFSSDTLRLSWLIVEGSQASPRLISPKLERIQLPADVKEGSGLWSLTQTLGLLIDTEKPEQIAVLQPGKSKFNNNSTVRIKVEAVLQIAAAQRNIPLHLVSPNAVSNHKKKLQNANTSLEDIFNKGEAFSPSAMGDVICVGVVKLPRG
jgi:hypothetical protein